MSTKKIKKSGEDISVDVFSYSLLTIFALSTLLPFINVIAKAVSEDWAVVSGKVGLLPVGFQLNTMKYVIFSEQFSVAFKNSILVTLVGTFCTIFITAMTAYPLSKRQLPGIKAILLIFVFTMYFNGGLIPNYLLIKQLGMLNKFRAIIIPGLINVFHLLIIKNYYESLPESLEESAKLDGAGNFTILFRIIAPLSLPVFATITLFTAIGHWNNYFGPMLYINSTKLKTLTLYLRDVIMDAQNIMNASAEDLMSAPTEGVKAATIIASTVPILLVYPFLQKYFIKGMLIGSVKG
jgi:putative aldouronate transport system permease protein